MKTYFKTFQTENDAFGWMVMKNRTNRDKNAMYCLVTHPEGFAVVDLFTAIDLGTGYKISNF